MEAGDTIFDMLRFVKPKVKILGTGWVASAGALIYASVPTEQRFSLPNTRYMLHQPSGGVGGQATDISIEAQEILKMRERLNKTFSVQTGQSVEKIEKDTDRNFWMSADEAKGYGLVGKVISSQGRFLVWTGSDQSVRISVAAGSYLPAHDTGDPSKEGTLRGGSPPPAPEA